MQIDLSLVFMMAPQRSSKLMRILNLHCSFHKELPMIAWIGVLLCRNAQAKLQHSAKKWYSMLWNKLKKYDHPYNLWNRNSILNHSWANKNSKRCRRIMFSSVPAILRSPTIEPLMSSTTWLLPIFSKPRNATVSIREPKFMKELPMMKHHSWILLPKTIKPSSNTRRQPHTPVKK